MKTTLFSSVAIIALAGAASADCPAVTVADMMGVDAGAFPQQFELAEFEALAGCTLEFSANPDAAALHARLQGSTDLPDLASRLPSQPLVVAPYESIGVYGGTLDMLSNATESGTTDLMSVRHVNLVRYSDDLQTIVPNVASSWDWNDDFTQLTFHLREGHRWSDGAPFGARDVKFWYDNLALDTNVRENTKDYVLVGGERMEVVVIDEVTVQFNLPAPKPGLLSHFAQSYAQGFQPMHFLGQFHPDVDADADANAQAIGFEDGYAVIAAYYGGSDWMDTPTPMLAHPDLVGGMPFGAAPTLESFNVISETTEGRHYVANPYFFQVDTAGNQLPYISEMDELFVSESEVRLLKLVNAEVDYKSQALVLDYAPLLLENQESGNYTVLLEPEISMGAFAFNVTSEDLAKREVFGDLRFRQAMSLAMNRDEINEVAYFGLGETQQYIGFSPTPDFIGEDLTQHFANFDPDRANALLDEVGLIDIDGDGYRELPNGEPLILNLQVATQGISMNMVQLVSQDWKNVGINSTVKEVTTDEYRSAQSANQLDVTMYTKGQPLAIIIGSAALWLPPFDTYFDHRTAMLWGEYVDTDGASGVEPPAYVYGMIDDIAAFQGAVVGTEESAVAGESLVRAMVENLLFIGTVKAVLPVYHSNNLHNFPEFTTQGGSFLRAYPYRGPQWYLTE
ncbi:MAG: ABC transporter substrate-binding protein [Rhodobacteraceae bacterium]|nr:ABC transporter substrate-binding protein [Paracoccaceae bacterium]PHR53386.1 MAG: peptide ABC transporter substrate-binding protein [Robiginitomaculum sp.]